MSDIKFNCPQCGQHIAVDATGAGMTVACPQCSLAILVPQPEQLAGQEPPRRAKRWWLLSAGIAAAMLIAGLLIWQAPWRKTTAAGTAAASSKTAENSRSAKANGKPIHPSAPALPDDLARGLVMHFNFDAEPIEGKIPDLSGQGNDGEAVGIQWDAQGHQGGSVVFGPTNNYIRVPNSDSLNPSNITLAVWIKAGKQGDPVRRVFDKNHADGYAISIGGEHHGAAGKVFVEIDMKVKNHACAGSDNPVTDGRWHHLAATYNGAEEIFFVDGVPQQGVERWKGIIPANSQDLTLGANRSNPNATLGEVGASFNGMMDDAMVFNRALSAEEIQRLYVLQKTKADAPPANIAIFALPKAAYEGNLEEVKALVAKGADVNAQWPKDANFTPLFFAVSKGHENIRDLFDIKKINELKDRTKNVDYPRQYAEIVSLLLANGADINTKDSYNRTPLLLSLGFGYSDMAKLLIAKGADVNTKDNWETTPLLSAALDNNKDMENLLMAKGAKVDIITASAMGDIERVKGFLNRNPSMNNATQNVFTPFHAAAFSGQTEMMKFLLEKGADVNAGYPEKQTPLYWAAYKGQLDAAELLIAKGAIINSESSNSPAPLFGAAWGGNKAIGELLIAKGADVNAKDSRGWTPLFAAAMTDKNGKDTVELLIAKGADVNAKDPDGRTPLWATVRPNHLEIARLLVSKGADVNAKKNDGLTALDIAARFAQKDFVEFLITNGADIHAIGDTGWTPLHYAAYGGNMDITEMLLAKGADANVRDKDDKTPAIVARDEGYTDVAELIKKSQDKRTRLPSPLSEPTIVNGSFESPTIDEAITAGSPGQAGTWADNVHLDGWNGRAGANKVMVVNGRQNLYWNDPQGAFVEQVLNGSIGSDVGKTYSVLYVRQVVAQPQLANLKFRAELLVGWQVVDFEEIRNTSAPREAHRLSYTNDGSRTGQPITIRFFADSNKGWTTGPEIQSVFIDDVRILIGNP